MKFGPVQVEHAEGAILAHATFVGGTRLRKAHRLAASDIEALKEAGITRVIVARLSPDDLDEDAAAARLAKVFATDEIEARSPTTGRVNLHATRPGLFTVSRAVVDAVNAVDPAVTLATLAPFTPVVPGQMVATVKIIPFAVPSGLIERARAAGIEAFAVHPFRKMRFGVVQTVLPGVKPSVLDKTVRITAGRLVRYGGSVGRELRPPHEEQAVSAAIEALIDESDMILVFGASAVCDEGDVIPAAIRIAGGRVERVGMPVDPGNLLVLGDVRGRCVIGAPGCARSPKTNGFDWVLDRLMAGLGVSSADIAAMGVGGLLAEIPSRPQPRETDRKGGFLPVWGLLLAAGQSRRMGPGNKLLAEFEGVPLVRRTGAALAAAQIDGAVAVLGHDEERVRAALDGLGLESVLNPAFAEGLSTSLRAGIAALPGEAAGVLVMLADMPEVTAADLDRLIAAFRDGGGGSVVRATCNGKRGNPVLLPRALFDEIARLEGDTGARHVVEQGLSSVIDVELGHAAGLDVDTPEALAQAGGTLIQ